MRRVGVGLLGAGNVGAGVIRILEENAASIHRRVGAQVFVSRVAVQDMTRARAVKIAPELLTTDAMEVIGDPEVELVVELIGGLEPAKSYVIAALEQRKHVVTANKAMMAMAGCELFARAAENNVSLSFEAAVAGGVPILRTLRDGLASDTIDTVWGIINGTCNYVLDAMGRRGFSFEEAVRAAQRAGFAEADPTVDIEGTDAAQKLALLCLVAFGVRVDPSTIPTEGIERVRAFDIAMADAYGYQVKSLAFMQRTESGIRLRVHPAWVPDGSILAGVQGSFNAVLVQSAAMGLSLYYGRGAGMMPTGMAVVSDIIDVCCSVVAFRGTRPPPEALSTVVEGCGLPLADECHENYLCVHVRHVPGVLGRVATALGRHGVSVKSVRQELQGPDAVAQLVIVTERVAQRRLEAALQEINASDEVLEPTRRIRIVCPDPPE